MTPLRSPRFRPILIWLGALALSGWWIVFHLSVQQNLMGFMPLGATDDEQLLVEGLAEGPGSRILLLSIGGADEERLAVTSRQLAERLRATGRFTRVENGAPSLDPAELERLFGWRYLLSPTVTEERFTVAGLRAALRARLEELASPAAPLVKQHLPADPTGEFRSLLLAWRPDRPPPQRLGVWFSPDGRQALLLAETRAAGFDLDEQEATLAEARAAFAGLAGSAPLRLTLSGPGAMAVASRAAIQSESLLLGIAASVLMAAILFGFYRSIRLVVLGALPLGTAILVATAGVAVVFGGVHGITLAFGITLMGVVDDYPLHVFSHLNGAEPVEATVRRVWPTVRLCAITAALGFSAMLLTRFPGLMQIGLFAVVGIAAAAMTTRWVVPALLPERWSPALAPERLPWLDPLLQPPRWSRWLAGAAGLAALLALPWLMRSPWEDDLAALSPVPRSAVEQYTALRTALGASEPGDVVLLVAPDADSALLRSEQFAAELEGLRERRALTGYDMAARYLPSRASQQRRRAALPDSETLARRLAAAQEGLAFRPGTFAPFLRDVASARARAPLGLDDLTGTTLGLRVATLLYPRGSHWIAAIPLAGVSEPDALAAWFAERDSPDTHYLHLKSLTERMMSRFRTVSLTRTGWVFALILGALWISLRSWRALLRVMAPVTLALAATLALLLAVGEKLSLFHVIALLLVLGIGSDYGLFFVEEHDSEVLRKRTLHAVLLGCTSTGLMFGLLALSSIPVLRAIGMTVAFGVFSSLSMAVLLAQGGPPPRNASPPGHTHRSP